MAEGFESLQVWQKAHALMLFVHREVVPHLLNGYIDYLQREKPGKNEPGYEINVYHPRSELGDPS